MLALRSGVENAEHRCAAPAHGKSRSRRQALQPLRRGRQLRQPGSKRAQQLPLQRARSRDECLRRAGIVLQAVPTFGGRAGARRVRRCFASSASRRPAPDGPRAGSQLHRDVPCEVRVAQIRQGKERSIVSMAVSGNPLRRAARAMLRASAVVVRHDGAVPGVRPRSLHRPTSRSQARSTGASAGRRPPSAD